MYLRRDPVTCPRCERERIPFHVGTGMCKSCYQVKRLHPDAAVWGSPEHLAKLSGQPGPRREASGKWKGGRFLNSQGYAFVLPPEGYEGPKVQGGRYIAEHRLVAERTIGRLLLPGEVVHHKNRDRADNRPENLQVLASVSEHRKLHAAEWQAQNRP